MLYRNVVKLPVKLELFVRVFKLDKQVLHKNIIKTTCEINPLSPKVFKSDKQVLHGNIVKPTCENKLLCKGVLISSKNWIEISLKLPVKLYLSVKVFKSY